MDYLKRRVKEYHLHGVFYDWVTYPKKLEKIFHRFRERKIVKLIKEYGRESITLDCGCGTGLITRHIRTPLTIGLDINLKKAKIHAPNAELVMADVEALPLRPNSVDTIVCTEVLEHIPSPEIAIQEIVSVLKRVGMFIGSVPSKSFIWRFRRLLTSTCPASEPFHRNYSTRELTALLKVKELKIIKVFRSCFGLTLFFLCKKV
jgi:ubiquinone/menaquinone biosynthesis C-methylase UbiE